MGVLGGDFYDAVQTGPQRVSVLVGDVCGHAVEEAALGVELRVAWRALTLAGVDEERLLRTLERILVSERRAAEIFATLATVAVDLTAEHRAGPHGRSSAADPDHRHRRAPADGGAVDRAGPAPGVPPTRPPRSSCRTAGWGLLVYTDGLIEARDGDDWLGTDGLCRMIDRYLRGGGGSDGLPEYLVAEAERRNGGPLADDVAMLLLSGGTRTVATELTQR